MREHQRHVTCDRWTTHGGALLRRMDLQVKCALNVSFCEATDNDGLAEIGVSKEVQNRNSSMVGWSVGCLGWGYMELYCDDDHNDDDDDDESTAGKRQQWQLFKLGQTFHASGILLCRNKNTQKTKKKNRGIKANTNTKTSWMANHRIGTDI